MHSGFMSILRFVVWTVASACYAQAATAQEPSETQVREEYNRWVSTLDKTEYRARHILVKDQETASSLLREIQAGASFAVLAAGQSTDTSSKAKGGDLGWVLPAYFTPSFRVAFRGLETGVHPTPIRTEFGWHVVEVQEARAVRAPTLEQARGRVTEQLRKRTAQSGAAAPAAVTAARSRPPSDWQTLFTAALQTAGYSSFEYYEAVTSSYDKAESMTWFGTTVSPRVKHKARHLIDVPPQHRAALMGLYLPDNTTLPLERVLADGTKQWTVLELIERGKATAPVPGAEFERDTESWIAQGKLKDVATLRTPAEQAKSLYWNFNRMADINKIDPSISADVLYDNQSTPLLDAIYANQLELAKRLVQRGADVNRCGASNCPIGLAVLLGPESRASTWVDWLLSQNAKVDQFDTRDLGRSSTALATALSAGHNLVAEKLLAAGANVNGAPGVGMTPAEAAASKLNKTMTERLIASGASVMPRKSDRGVGVNSIYAILSDDERLSAGLWAQQLILKQAATHPKFRLSLQVEQNGRTVAVNPNGPTLLKAAPFKLAFAIPQESGSVQIGASLEAAWVDEIKRTDPRNSMFRPMSSSALSDTDKPDSGYILMSLPCPKAENARDAEKGCDESYAMHLDTDPTHRKDFHSTRPGTPMWYVRDVDHFAGMVDKNAPKGPARDTQLAAMKGRTVYFVAGISISLGGAAGLRLINPQYFQLKFQ